MTYRVIYTEKYLKSVALFIRHHPDLKGKYLKTIQLLEANPFHPSLRLHALAGNSQGLHSVSINMSYRITLEFLIVGNEITPIDIGSHEDVY